MTLHPTDVGKEESSVWWTGEATFDPGELERALRDGWAHDAVDGWAVENPEPGKLLFLAKPNLVVNTGINRSLDRTFGLTNVDAQTVIIDSIGVDNGTVNPTATTALSADGNSTSRTIILFSSVSRTAQVVTAQGTFTNSNVAFIMKRLFLNKTTTDASGNLYSMTNVFTLDFVTGSPFTSWSQAFTATVTGTGS